MRIKKEGRLKQYWKEIIEVKYCFLSSKSNPNYTNLVTFTINLRGSILLYYEQRWNFTPTSLFSIVEKTLNICHRYFRNCSISLVLKNIKILYKNRTIPSSFSRRISETPDNSVFTRMSVKILIDWVEFYFYWYYYIWY